MSLQTEYRLNAGVLSFKTHSESEDIDSEACIHPGAAIQSHI